MMTLSSPLLTAQALALAAVLIAAAPAGAQTQTAQEATLRGDITIAGAIVTVGDLFANAGPLAPEGLFRAPAPGTAGTLSLADIENAAQRAGLDTFDASGLTTIRVAREGVAVDAALLESLIVDDLVARGIMTEDMTLDLSFDQRLPALVAPAVETPVTLDLLRYHPGAGTLSARFALAEADAPLEVTGQVEMLIEAPHLATSVPAGTILSPDDITFRQVPLAFAESGGVPDLVSLVGMQVRRALREGVMLRADDVTEPELISRNASVTVVYRSGALTLTTTGQALNAASLHEPVAVLNPMTRKVLSGTAAAAGTVIVPGAPQAVAGL